MVHLSWLSPRTQWQWQKYVLMGNLIKNSRSCSLLFLPKLSYVLAIMSSRLCKYKCVRVSHPNHYWVTRARLQQWWLLFVFVWSVLTLLCQMFFYFSHSWLQRLESHFFCTHIDRRALVIFNVLKIQLQHTNGLTLQHIFCFQGTPVCGTMIEERNIPEQNKQLLSLFSFNCLSSPPPLPF